MAEDSLTMVMMALYNLLILNGAFMALRISRLSRTIRAIIMRVRRTSSETEIEYGTPTLMIVERQMVQLGCEIW
jgi:hypothetical protein